MKTWALPNGRHRHYCIGHDILTECGLSTRDFFYQEWPDKEACPVCTKQLQQRVGAAEVELQTIRAKLTNALREE